MSTCSQMKFTLPVLKQLSVNIKITENPYGLPFDELFTMAARINKKRAFLFVSKVLGKHIPVNPNKSLLVGALLANRYIETVKGKNTEKKEMLLAAFNQTIEEFQMQPFISENENPIIIAFAETATALGHAFFENFRQADFFHTTREQIIGVEPAIVFEEEHSHATSHRCYVDGSMLNNEREIILVDDEMTTGKTNINIIRQIQERFPRKTYTVVSILDWRSEENLHSYSELEEELNIVIHSVSLLKGSIQPIGKINIAENIGKKADDFSELPEITNISIETSFPGMFNSVPFISKAMSGDMSSIPYLNETGRFGINSKMNVQLNRDLSEIGTYLAKKRNGDKTLCLGTGEFMYLPMKLASFMGYGVSYQSTTRSPIYVRENEDYGARFGLAFPNPEDSGMEHFVYNIPPFEYDELFLFIERAVPTEKLLPFLGELKKTTIKDVKVVFFNGG
ncbi:phosphoribosyltransferase family protein [Bacillus sp. Bva_UNVM-123]